MKILTPMHITNTEFVSSTLPENDYPVWAAGTSYALAARVIRVETHSIYESLEAANTGNTPETSPTKWRRVSATNRWAMFDLRNLSRQSVADETLTVALKPGIINSVSLINLSASEVQISLTDPDYGVLFDETYSLRDTTGVTSWWAFFFQRKSFRDSLFVPNIPTSLNGTLQITLNWSAGIQVGLGALLVGRLHDYAYAVHAGATVSIEDYSRREINQWGDLELTERNWARRAAWEVLVENKYLDDMQRVVASLRGTPALFVGSDKFDSTLVYGLCREFDQVISYPKHFMCRMNLLGLSLN